MIEQESCYKNRTLYDARLGELIDKYWAGETLANHTHLTYGQAHRKLTDEGKSLRGCACTLCERNRGRVDGATVESCTQFDNERAALLDDYKNGPPVPDSPSLWETWPDEEETI